MKSRCLQFKKMHKKVAGGGEGRERKDTPDHPQLIQGHEIDLKRTDLLLFALRSAFDQ